VLAAAGGTAFASGPGSLVTYTAAAAAPVAQLTEDEPTAAFHPEGEGDYGYTLVTADPSDASALAAVVWPGAAIGNAGTLITVLGGPSGLSALNDPVQASATSGTGRTHSTVATPAGTVMSASVVPNGPADQHASASSRLAGGSLGPLGSIGSSASSSTIDFEADTGTLTVSATSEASHLEIDGVVSIGSVTSFAQGRSVGGGAPRLSGRTSVQDLSIAGRRAYLDGSGLHLGAPGEPAGPAAMSAVDAALARAGMEIYVTAPHTITVGEVRYFSAASLLFFWAPPGDPSHNSVTMTVGGSGVALSESAVAPSGLASPSGTRAASAGAPGGGGGSPGALGGGGSGNAAGPGRVRLGSGLVEGGLGFPAALGAAGEPTLALPAPPTSAGVGAGPSALAVAPSGATAPPGGVAAGWWLLAAVAAVLGGGLGIRVPSLLEREAASECPLEQPARRGRRSGMRRPVGAREPPP
jgi:hypothetical protein